MFGLVLGYFMSYKWDDPLLTPHNWAELDPAGRHVDAGSFVKWEEVIQHLPCISTNVCLCVFQIGKNINK